MAETALTDAAAPADTSSASPKTLRWWPVPVLLGLMLFLRYLPGFFEVPPISVWLTAFISPLVVGLLLLSWLLFFSRLTGREKLTATLVGGLIVGVSALLLHPSMQGLGMMIHLPPAALLGFGIPLALLAPFPRLRVPVALLVLLFSMGYYDLLQSAGITGEFQSELSWRWEPTAEEQYLAELNQAGEASPVSADQETIQLADAQWSAFRGPRRDGRQPGVTLAENWPTQLEPVWRKRIGPAWSSFSVAGDRLFTQEQRDQKEAVVCLDARTGAPLWACEQETRFWEAAAGAGPRATPTIADEGLFSLGANGLLLCLDPVTGDIRWQADISADSNRKPPEWGFSASPLVTNGLVIVHAGGPEDHGVLAYAATSGELKWSTASGDHTYSSPHLATFADTTGILMVTNTALQFLEVETGKLLWEHPWFFNGYRVLQPLVYEDSVLMATGFGVGTRRIAVQKQGDAWQATELWTSNQMKSEFNDFVEHKGHLYGFDSAIFSSIDLETGKRNWKGGRYGKGQVLLLPDQDQLLVLSDTGEVVLLKAAPDKLHELARFQAITGKTWNHPVLVGNRLYVRNAEEAACYELPLASASGKSASTAAR